MSTYRKDNIVQETKELAQAARENTEKGEAIILGRTFAVFPKVFDPRIFFSTNWFAENISKLVQGDTHFCEIGCGTGAVTVSALLTNPELHAVAVDINPHAVDNTKDNAGHYNLQERLEVFVSDVFDTIPKDSKFDSIFWAMPFGYLEEGEEVDIVDTNTFDPGYRAIEKFFAETHLYLKSEGRLLIGFSHEIGTDELLQEICNQHGFKLKLLMTEQGTEKSPVTMQIYEAR